MITMKTSTIELWTSVSKSGNSIPKKYYELVKAFILSELLTKEEVTLTELIHEADKTFASDFGVKISWYLLEVKKDLQARNLIRVSFMPERVQCIRIKMESKRKVKEWLNSFKVNDIK